MVLNKGPLDWESSALTTWLGYNFALDKDETNFSVTLQLPPRSGTSLEAVEPHPYKGAIKFF